MNDPVWSPTRVERWLRRAARSAAAFLIVFVLTFTFGERIDMTKLSGVESTLGISLLAALFGFVLIAAPPWRHPRRELSGAVLSITAVCIFYATEWWHSGAPPSGWVLPLLFLPGTLEFLAVFIFRLTERSDHVMAA